MDEKISSRKFPRGEINFKGCVLDTRHSSYFLLDWPSSLVVVKEVEEDDQSNNHQDQQILSGIGSTFVGITGPCGFHGPLFLFHLFELLANGSIDTGMMIGSLENLSSPTRNIKQSWKFRMIIQFLFFSSDKGHTHTPSRSAHALLDGKSVTHDCRQGGRECGESQWI